MVRVRGPRASARSAGRRMDRSPINGEDMAREKASKSRRAMVHAVASVHKRPQKRGAPGAVRLAVRFDRFAFGRAVVE